MGKNIISRYNQYYSKRADIHVYPFEFVVRTFLGSYPNLKMDRSRYAGSKILDLGYGDGRNMPLLSNLKFQIYGIEISEEINKLADERLKLLGIDAELKVGTNDQIPYHENFFDYVLACHSCYYIKANTTFDDNLSEISRVLKQKGIFCASLPMPDNFIFKNAEALPEGYFRIVNDPYGIRNGTVQKTFFNEQEIIKKFSTFYYDITIGYCIENFFGINLKVWIIVAVRK